ncbi:MAG TPA: lysylphosphatidylglycerol synthase domain-containing protein [Haliangiales bacterium]|nr:lysylphosphatidylglycerol synthase domain-containing protein [Haliangiales bacterium]
MPEPKRRSLLQVVGPWLVAAVIFVWLFRIVPFSKLVEALANAPLGAFVALTLAYVWVNLCADTFATWATFHRALPEVPLTYRETLVMRGATYLLAVVHYGAGQGGLAYFLNRRHGVEVARTAGTVMLVMGVNVVVVAMCAFVGILAGGAPEAAALRWVVLAFAAGFPAYLLVIALRPRFLARVRLLQPLFQAGLRGHAVAIAARLPHMAVLVGGNFAAMHLFGVTPPLGKALVLLPIVFVLAVLPISPSGLGTAQAAAVTLFAEFAHGATLDDRRAAVAAYSLGLQFLALIVQAALGVVFLRRATR